MMSENVSFRSALHGFHRADVLAYIKNLIDENASLTAALESARAELAAAKSEAQEMQRQLADSAAEKQNEQTLGRAMCDARRMSDLIVAEARQQADEMYADAADAADFAAGKAEEISAQAEAFHSFFDEKMEEIYQQLAELQTSMQSFRADVEQKKAESPAAAVEKAGESAPEKPLNRHMVRKVKR